MHVGSRIAEEESDELTQYFVQTDQWARIYSGDVDIIYGTKGSGKSAIYALILNRQDELFDANIITTPAENPRGTTVFSGLVTDPPPSEHAFRNLWKLYILTLIGSTIQVYGINNTETREVLRALNAANLLSDGLSIEALFRKAKNYIKQKFNQPTTQVEYTVTVDPQTLMTTASRRAEYGKSEIPREQGPSTDELLRVASDGLRRANIGVWVLFDRLDVAFAESYELEGNALRALFRCYNDLKSLRNISLKIFVRDDIWKRITAGGFPEASHITRYITLEWSQPSLINLIVRRLLNNSPILRRYDLDKDDVLSDFSKQRQVFYRLFPLQVDSGPKNPSTFDWIVSRVADANEKTMPREVIHLLTALREEQLNKLERGEPPPDGDALFDKAAVKDALKPVSQARLDQTLLAENPQLVQYIRALEGEKTQQTVSTLSRIWSVDDQQAERWAWHLVEVGFFKNRGTKDVPQFWVPFLYRPALNLVQGSAQ